MITLTTKSNNINLATTPGSVEVGEQGKDNINLAANENSINLQTEKDRIEFNSTKYLKGDKGEPGADGFSPIVEVEEVDGGHSISITDATGTDTFIVKDGVGGGGSGEHDCAQSDWNVNDETDPSYIHNRTHYETDPYVISWDGYFEDSYIIHEDEESMVQMAKVCDEIADPDKLLETLPKDITMLFHSIPGEYEDYNEPLNEEFTGEEWGIVENTEDYIWLENFILYVKREASVYQEELGYLGEFAPGLYVYYYIDQETCFYIDTITLAGEVIKIDPKYMPDEVMLKDGDNIVIEDAAINVYTNTGYAISDKDIKIQPILDNRTSGVNHIVYTDNEVMVIWNGTIKIKRSTNGIDFESIQLPYTCKSMFYNPVNQRIYGLTYSGYYIYSDDDGLTWEAKQSNLTNGDYICRGESHVSGFKLVNKNTRRITGITDTFGQSGYITSTITPAFCTQFAQHQFIWCNSQGTFKYGAGSQEGNFASLSGITVSCLKNIEGYPIVGLRANNKIYRLKNFSGITDNEWVAYTLPKTCTVNDIILNPYDKTYYILTTTNTYFKTKDFTEFESVDKDGLRGVEGCFTLMGIQATVADQPNKLLLAPTRTKLENKAQEWDRALNKERWAGNGLRVEGEKIHINAQAPLVANDNYIFLAPIEEHYLPDKALEATYVATAPIHLDFDPYSMDTWYWEFGFPEDTYSAHKIVFNQEGSFFDQMMWETEYFVEQYEYGYIFSDYEKMKYVKLGNLAPLFT